MTAWPSSSSAFLPASTSVWLKLLPTLGWLTMMSTFFLPSAAAGNGFEKFASNAMAEGSLEVLEVDILWPRWERERGV